MYGAGTDCLLVHAPFALTPVPFPRQAFQRALDAAEPFNSMIDAVSQDVEYLTEVLENAAREDADFTVWSTWLPVSFLYVNHVSFPACICSGRIDEDIQRDSTAAAAARRNIPGDHQIRLYAA